MTVVKRPMLTAAQALELLLAAAVPVGDIENVETLHANGRVLAQTQTSNIDVPSLDNSQMDGYAVRCEDFIDGQATLRVAQRIPAGKVGQPLESGTAARIFTGASVPAGANAIVMQEHCTQEGDQVHIPMQPKSGEWIRRRGEDIRAGADILLAGTKLRAQECGLAASVGIAQLTVFRKLRVAVFFTGDELAMPGEPLQAGAIYNSNRFVLRGLLENLECEISDFGIVPDNLEATRATLRQAAAQHDLIITSGGVSVGEEDHVKPAVEAEGRLAMWQIAIKPGKPLAFGAVNREGGQAFFIGLPGNPVSSFVTFLLFVRPFILKCQGATNTSHHHYVMRANFSWPKVDKRNEFLRAKINANGDLDLFDNQGSGVLTSTVWGDGLVDVALGEAVSVGSMVKFIPFAGLV